MQFQLMWNLHYIIALDYKSISILVGSRHHSFIHYYISTMFKLSSSINVNLRYFRLILDTRSNNPHQMHFSSTANQIVSSMILPSPSSSTLPLIQRQTKPQKTHEIIQLSSIRLISPVCTETAPGLTGSLQNYNQTTDPIPGRRVDEKAKINTHTG